MAKKSKKNLEKLNETGKRKSGDRRKKKTAAEAKAAMPAVDRRKVKRRRQIDPTTCEREYSDNEIEFMKAMMSTSEPADVCSRLAARSSKFLQRWVTAKLQTLKQFTIPTLK